MKYAKKRWTLNILKKISPEKNSGIEMLTWARRCPPCDIEWNFINEVEKTTLIDNNKQERNFNNQEENRCFNF